MSEMEGDALLYKWELEMRGLEVGPIWIGRGKGGSRATGTVSARLLRHSADHLLRQHEPEALLLRVLKSRKA